MSDRNNVTWKWLAGIAFTILLAGGGAWMSTMSAQVNKVQEDAKQDRKAVGDIDKKVGVIEEQTKRTQEDVKEIKDTQKDTNKKLDELLRRR
mgnify:CR=1 FL=1